MKIADAVCVVTGGNSGLGAAAVAALLARGARVVALDLTVPATAVETDRLSYLACDVTSEAAAVAALTAAVARFGAVHVCINCAGILHNAPAVSEQGVFPIEAFRRVIDVNLHGTFLMTCRAAEQMCKNALSASARERGVIINISSVRATEGGPGGAAYAASKGGVAAMTLSLARDLGAYAIRVMTIAPGLIETPMLRMMSDETFAQYSARIAFPKRAGEPAEFAALVCHIIENEYLNAETIRLDAGIRL